MCDLDLASMITTCFANSPGRFHASVLEEIEFLALSANAKSRQFRVLRILLSSNLHYSCLCERSAGSKSRKNEAMSTPMMSNLPSHYHYLCELPMATSAKHRKDSMASIPITSDLHCRSVMFI
jgi:hypothetical protein